MLPSLAPQDLREASVARVVHVPPPEGFRPIVGTPREVFRAGRQPVFSVDSLNAAQKSGLRYEDHVQRMLCDWDHGYIASPTFTFVDDLGRRMIRPDGYLWGKECIFIFEIKIRHMPEAYWQLMHLYRPALQVRHPRHRVVCVEVCGSYDPAMPFPYPVDMVELSALADYRGDLGVVVWHP